MAYNHIISLSAKELYDRALIYKNDKDYNNYSIYMTMSANYGYELAKEDLHDDYDNYELYHNQDYSITKKFYEFTQDYGYSLMYLGYIYEFEDEDRDYDKAKNFYELAIKKGNVPSINNLAVMYRDGRVTTPDFQKAKELFKIAIIKGYMESINNLGTMYYKGKDVKLNINKARIYFQMGIDGGSSYAMTCLGKIYYNEHNYIKAKELWEMAIKKGNVHALNQLGLLYKRGQVIKRNFNRAKKLFELAIDKGNLDCINDLVDLYGQKNSANDVGYVINYFLKIEQAARLKQIYKYKNSEIEIFKEWYNLKIENNEQKNLIAEYEAHIMASPDGKLYFEMKADWDVKVNKKPKLENKIE